MIKLKFYWLNIPRPIRVLINIIAVLIISVTFYVCIGAPTINAEHAFRREARANLLDSSIILFNEKVENYPYDEVILAETENCVITWVDDDWFGFNYHEKTGDITVVTAPAYWFDFGQHWFEVNLPVFVVDDYPEAVQAVLELDIQGVYVHNLNDQRLEEPLDHQFALSSHREGDGFFWFRMNLPYLQQFDEDGAIERTHGVDGYALDALADTFTNAMTVMNPQSNTSITAVVRLYDEQENLVAEKELILRTLSDETQS